jgi:hypothetical protein
MDRYPGVCQQLALDRVANLGDQCIEGRSLRP